MTELSRSGMQQYFRPNFFTNTPDILPEILQQGGMPACKLRAVLAATLSPTYGIYSGFELCEHEPLPGREEYKDSEKYEIKVRDWNAPGNIKSLDYAPQYDPAREPLLGLFTNLRFLETDNDQILFYAKATPDGGNVILVAVNLDPAAAHYCTAVVPPDAAGVAPGNCYRVTDLLTGTAWTWRAQLRASRSGDRAGPHLCGHETHFKYGDNSPVARRAAMVQGRDRLRGPRALVLRSATATASVISAADEQARLSAGPRRHRAVVAAVLSVAAARRRLRHFRLHRRPSRLGTLTISRPFCARPTARPPRHHRAGAQSHLGPASVVSARAPRAAGQPSSAISTSGATRPSAITRRGSSFRISNCRTGRGIRWPRRTTGIASTRISPI